MSAPTAAHTGLASCSCPAPLGLNFHVLPVSYVQAGQEKLCARFAEAAAALTDAGEEIETWQRLFPFVPLTAE